MAALVTSRDIPVPESRKKSSFGQPSASSPSTCSTSPPWTFIDRPSPSQSSASTNASTGASLSTSSGSSYIMVSGKEGLPDATASRSAQTHADDNIVQLLFSKSKVYVHPSASSKDHIAGFLVLVRPKGAPDSEILFSWIPEFIIESEEYNSYVQVDMNLETNSTTSSMSDIYVTQPPTTSSYAFSIPLSDLRSLQVKSPSMTWWWGSLVPQTRSQETLPTLFFHDSESSSTLLAQKQSEQEYDPFGVLGGLATSSFLSGDNVWGGAQFLKALGVYSNLGRSKIEPSIILVNPVPEDQALTNDSLSPTHYDDKTLSATLVNAKYVFLENMAKITRLSIKTSQGVLDNAPVSIRKLLNQPEVKRIGDDFSTAKYYLAKWAMRIAEEAERSQRQRMLWHDGYSDFITNYGNMIGFDFEVLDVEFDVERRPAVDTTEWRGFFDATGKLRRVSIGQVKDRIFHGGCSPEIRTEAWLFLLGVYPWDSTSIERQKILTEKKEEYQQLKRQWQQDTTRQKSDEIWKDQKCRIEKDVYRTDRSVSLFQDSDAPHPDGPESRFADFGTNLHLELLKEMLITYNEHNTRLGYIQGMSDLLSPLYVTFQEDYITFAAFCEFMVRMERNFVRDQSGMRDQMRTVDHLVAIMDPELYGHLNKADSTNFFFCFRMLLVWFKREFKWDQVLRLWEVLWTDRLSSQFVLFLVLALLDKHRKVILTQLHEFDEILKYMNDLAMSMDLDDLLVRAEVLFKKFKRTVEAVDRRDAERRMSCSGDSALFEGKEEATTISPELRQLLSQELVILKETQTLGEGYEG